MVNNTTVFQIKGYLMKLEIHKKGCTEIVTLDIEPTASVSDLLTMLYEYREPLLEKVPLEVYQKVVVIHTVDLYSEHFVTKLEPGKLLADYSVNESSYVSLDNFTHDNFFFILNRINANYDTGAPVLGKRTRTHFFGDGLNEESQSDENEYAKLTPQYLIS
jgi:hypothetical protein